MRTSGTTSKPAVKAGHNTGGNLDDDRYNVFLGHFHDLAAPITPVFTTNIKGETLWDIYLSAFKTKKARQHHNCNTCRAFIRRYGNLVTIDPTTGETRSLFWNAETVAAAHGTPVQRAINAMAVAMTHTSVSGVFYTTETEWGTARTGIWSHLCFKPSKGMLRQVTAARPLTPHQASAKSREEFDMLYEALAVYSPEVREQAYLLTRLDVLFRGEKIKQRAEWFRDLGLRFNGARAAIRMNLVWLAAAVAPAGWCYINSSVFGKVLDDLTAGVSADEIRRRYNAMLNPLKYQRPTAPPAAGTVKQAEDLFAKLGAGNALLRRLATLDEVREKIWTPREAREGRSGQASTPIFADLLDAAQPRARVVGLRDSFPGTMTWVKFQKDLLPFVRSMRTVLTSGRRRSVAFLTTAQDPTAPPILQWDTEARRNPFAWYVWHGGTSAAELDLMPDRAVEVVAAVTKPWMWNGEAPGCEHHGRGVILVLKGATETRRSPGSGIGLFPEFLKSEFHGIRSVIEAHGKRGTLGVIPKVQQAIGLLIHAGPGDPRGVELDLDLAGGLRTRVIIDRYE